MSTTSRKISSELVSSCSSPMSKQVRLLAIFLSEMECMSGSSAELQCRLRVYGFPVSLEFNSDWKNPEIPYPWLSTHFQLSDPAGKMLQIMSASSARLPCSCHACCTSRLSNGLHNTQPATAASTVTETNYKMLLTLSAFGLVVSS